MANVFIWITSVLLLVSAYFAYKNHTMYEEEISLKNQSAQRLSTNRDDLSEKIDTRDGLIADVKETREATAKAESEEKDANKSVTELTAEISTKEALVGEKDSELAKLQQKEQQFQEFQQLLPGITALRNERENLKEDLQTKENTKENLMAQKESTDTTRSNLKAYDDQFSAGESFFPSARITAIYPTWGFVTINAGNSSGAVAGTTLDVVRDGEVVAKLRVRTVETSRSAADVIPDEVAEGVVLMTGDRVVPSKKENEESTPEVTARAQ